MVMLSERVASSDGGSLRRLAVYKPGIHGVVQLDFYLPPSAQPAWVDPVVRKLLDSVHFDESFATRDLAPGESAPLTEELASVLRAKPHLLFLMAVGALSMARGILRRLRG